ncbi:hypothetical protein CDD83_6460 [Cordyceps sp. RAO-2017]|nr:hypothetical protein CDD83_6460 [Cordyceps sp. RAO-2017]
MAYAQWIVVAIVNMVQNRDLTVKNAHLYWGKFFDCYSKDNEVSTHEVEGSSAAPFEAKYVGACGRSDSASGTEGSFDVYDDATKICRVYWSCPWGSKDNEFRVEDYNQSTSAYQVTVGPWSRNSGAIGTVVLTIRSR